MLLIFAFVVSSCITFGTVLFMTRATPEEKAVSRRLAGVKNPQGSVQEGQELDLYLKTLQRGSFGWLEDMAAGSALAKKLQHLIMQADASTTPGTVMMTCLGAGAVAAGVVYLFT
jgi:hypothetical protein